MAELKRGLFYRWGFALHSYERTRKGSDHSILQLSTVAVWSKAVFDVVALAVLVL